MDQYGQFGTLRQQQDKYFRVTAVKIKVLYKRIKFRSGTSGFQRRMMSGAGADPERGRAERSSAGSAAHALPSCASVTASCPGSLREPFAEARV
ncbi:hypothetical protein JZ751_017929 [Albula glossodonta]|uniref:Uncharacterized protein n=1 Tax=Albula glossodonta TaxID=121402 RepID=A0A8T2PPR6_9TELE|nr:hypothetical protein JZ751_017929 [Albula glossodonta]